MKKNNKKFVLFSLYLGLFLLISLISQNSVALAFPFGDLKASNINQINGHHARSTIALSDDGEFVVCRDDQGRYFNSEGWIQCQRFNPDGSKNGGEVQVNSSPHYVVNANLIMDSTKNYVVCWNDGVLNAVRCRKVDENNNLVGSEFQANTTGYLGSTNTKISVGIGSDDNFIVCWEGVPNKEGNTTSAVYCQNFDKQTEIIGNEFRIDDGTYQFNMGPSVSRNNNGLSVICWTTEYEVVCQRLEENDNKIGNNFKINAPSEYQIDRVKVGLDNSLNILTCWEEYGNTGVSEKIKCQRINKDSQKIGSQFQPYTFQGTKFTGHNLSVNENGESVVCWQSQGQIGLYDHAFCQQYNSDGSLHFTEYKTALLDYDSESEPSVSLNNIGQIVSCWDVNYLSGNPTDIYCNGRQWGNDPNPSTTPTSTPTPTNIPTPTPVSMAPTETPTPTPSPMINYSPVITTKKLPSGKINKKYNTWVSGYDKDKLDILEMNFLNLPNGLRKGACVKSYYRWFNRTEINCPIVGKPLNRGYFNIKITLEDDKGNLKEKFLPLSIK